MKEKYNPNEIEQLAQDFWHNHKSFKANAQDNKEKFYCLSMFPYPSGNLHIGHIRNYTISDVIARYQRMLGKNVLHPIGWDAFGLPAENAAMKNNSHPGVWTHENIRSMRKQLQRMGFGYDWDREITTCKPEYYKWEQWFFTQLYKKQLVYKKLSSVNWCPNDKTVLANEQVEDGKCWRCDTQVERKYLSQWFVKITDYAEELLSDLDKLPDWPEQVKTMQRNWIGKSEGVEVYFNLVNQNNNKLPATLQVFTTRVDTLMGVSYLAIAPDHPISKELANNNSKIKYFLEQSIRTGVAEAEIAKEEKKGIDTKIQVEHPITKEKIPVWIANFVLMSYGSGAVMSVPAHDQRDFEFATKYNIPIKQVITTTDNQQIIDLEKQAFVDKGILINSGKFDGLQSDAAIVSITDSLVVEKLGNRKTNYRLRDWGVSRQRYWGTPIPICYLEDGNAVAVDKADLPVVMPEKIDLKDPALSLKANTTWYNTTNNKAKVTRETDTFDTFMESSWYYARYCSANNNEQMLDEQANYWLPVDQYVGGIEHAVMHLLYARFFHKLMRDMGLVSCDEPFKKLLCQGMVIADSYYSLDKNGVKNWFSPELVDKTTCTLHASGEKVLSGGVCKMSKSKNNGVSPQKIIENYGADSLRLYTMFAAPAEQSMTWSEDALEGANRFLRRFYNYSQQNIKKGKILPLDTSKLTARQADFRRKIHLTIKKVSDDYGRRLAFNTGIAAIMELNNELLKYECTTTIDDALTREAVVAIIKMLNPITPHLAHYLWQKLHNDDSIDILQESWPVIDERAIKQNSIKYIIQVNGKLRGNIEVSVDTEQEKIKKIATENINVQKYIAEKTIKRIILVPGKLINIVI